MQESESTGLLRDEPRPSRVGAVAVVALCGFALLAASPRSAPASLRAMNAAATIQNDTSSAESDGICPMSVGDISVLGVGACSTEEVKFATMATTNDNFGCGQSEVATVGYKEANVSCRGDTMWLNGTGRDGWTLGCTLAADVGNIAGDCSLCGIVPPSSPHYPRHDHTQECSLERDQGCWNYTQSLGAQWPGCDRVRTTKGDGCPADADDADCSFEHAANCYPCFGTTCDGGGPYAEVKYFPSRTMPGELWARICTGSATCLVRATNVNASDHTARQIAWTMTNAEGVSDTQLIVSEDSDIETYDTADDDDVYVFDDMNLKILSMCNYAA